MTARSASLMLSVAAIVAACGPRVIASPQTPPPGVQLDLARLPRVWVAGFVAGTEQRFDMSAETVRLLRERLSVSVPAGLVDAAPVPLANEDAFVDRGYWQRWGAELGHPLIVTGSVRLLVAPPIMVQRGRRTTYAHATGRVLRATVVLIDGGTGAVVARKELPQRTRYAVGRFSLPGLYYDLMDQALTDWLATIATFGRTATTRKTGGGC